jgi:hypothetical protein
LDLEVQKKNDNPNHRLHSRHVHESQLTVTLEVTVSFFCEADSV